MSLKISDIAKKAGVSKTAVSFALNNKPGISPETRKRILDIVEQYGYMPKALIRHASEINDKKNTRNLFLLLSCSDTPFTSVENGTLPLTFFEIINEIERATNENNYDMLFKTLPPGKTFKKELQSILHDHNISGIIFFATAIEQELLDIILSMKKPLVALDANLQETSVDCVVMDNYFGGYLAGDYLANLGHRDIGYIQSTVRIHNFKSRRNGFEAALCKHSISLEVRNVFQVGSTIDECEVGFGKIIKERKDLPTALFAENDYLAIGTIKALNSAGIAIPENISIVGFDNIMISSIIYPGLTTINVPKFKLAELAVKRLIERIENPNDVNQKIFVSTEILKRKSCRSII